MLTLREKEQYVATLYMSMYGGADALAVALAPELTRAEEARFGLR